MLRYVLAVLAALVLVGCSSPPQLVPPPATIQVSAIMPTPVATVVPTVAPYMAALDQKTCVYGRNLPIGEALGVGITAIINPSTAIWCEGYLVEVPNPPKFGVAGETLAAQDNVTRITLRVICPAGECTMVVVTTYREQRLYALIKDNEIAMGPLSVMWDGNKMGAIIVKRLTR